MEKIWIKKAKSFSEANIQNLEYYFKMSPEDRIETVQFLREQYIKFGKVDTGESGKRLRRIIRIVQQA